MIQRRNVLLLLSIITFVLRAASKAESLEVSVSVRPSGSNLYLGESVLLRCRMQPRSVTAKSYRWFRSRPLAAPNPRHMVSGDRYYITAVTREDTDGYWCQAKCQENNTVFSVDARPVTLTVVSDLRPPSLSLTPNSRHMFSGERFTLRCPTSRNSSSQWKLLHFPSGPTAETTVVTAPQLAVAGRVSAVFTFVAAQKNSGLYWCEGPEGRSNAVGVTVSYGGIIFKTPAFPVAAGEDVVLSCQYRTGSHNTTRFFKDGAEIDEYNSTSSGKVVRLRIRNVTQGDEGFYSCASRDRRFQSPQSWLSVRSDTGNFTSVEESPASTSDSWKWSSVSCVVLLLLFFTPLCLWLIYHYRYRVTCARSCWPAAQGETGAEPLPATKQDVTEVQWDLSWMEMSNLLHKDVYCGT